MMTVLLALVGFTAPPAIAKNVQVEVSNKALANMTWEIFAGGCIENSTNLAGWANKQIYIRKAKIDDKSKIAGLWKNLGYPVPDELVDMWGTIGKKVWLYQHQNQGCTVTSSANVSTQMIESAFENLGKSYEAKNQMHYKLDSKSGKNTSVVLLTMGMELKQKTYLLARILPNNKAGIKIILYQFKTDKGVGI
ncbi:MAG: hypothetical protein H6858_05205 [Rhodospirillales bacterium]|nr:hypothetical protein [Rhodospirillales bacterium]